MIDIGLSDIPEVSTSLYREIVDFADGTPEPVRWFAMHFTEWSIIMLGVLLVAAAVPRLGAGPSRLALALAAPVAVVLAYGGSELLKSVVDEDRPCRTPADLVIIAGHCPPVGDWSFPSNHSTIAGALAAAILLLSRRLAWYAVPLAVLAAFSRTFVGVHYPHDVAAGLLLGALVGTVGTPLLARPVAELLRRRERRAAGPVALKGRAPS
ncbi:phosphatase PAP2 family protein [Micromonospora olivasterospora]|uniref:Undecaprenyl-diphosphatase n=1 Tax=Micromonospora olivasterospora TaxID=1880 RepID=A0A562IA99_MICOL|nr:phosphatase PAP2 family protein [Micromonospora olivasterospora]TWH67718.1 undecaprenyl-diphosphatase [Micromonospora olivasterospora]